MKQGESSPKAMASFSNNQLNVIGRIKVQGIITLHSSIEFVDLFIQVIDNKDVGKDKMRRLLFDICSERDKDLKFHASMTAKYPMQYEFPLYLETVERLVKVKVKVNLGPKEAKIIRIKIREPHRLNIGDKVVVTCPEDTGLYSIPSLNEVTEQWEIFVTIYNLSNQPIIRTIDCICEVIPEDFGALPQKPSGRPSIVCGVPSIERADFDFQGILPEENECIMHF